MQTRKVIGRGVALTIITAMPSLRLIGCNAALRAAVLAVATTVSAPSLGDDEGVDLVETEAVPRVSPETVVELDVTPVGDGLRPRVFIERAPVDANLAPTETGWTLTWRTPERLPSTSTIVLAAVDPNNPRRRQRVVLEFATAASNPSDTATPVLSEDIVVVDAVVEDEVVEEPVDEVIVDKIATAPDNDNDNDKDTAVLAAAPTAASPLSLPKMAPQRLLMDRPFSLWVRVDTTHAEDAAAITSPDAPEGLTVTERDEGWHELAWNPSSEQVGTHLVTLVATDKQDPLRQTREQLRLLVVAASSQASLTSPDGLSAEDNIVAVAPELIALPNLIVSAGRTIQFRVNSQLPDGQSAVVQIDRLPRNASFEENSDGSRTFHWLTGDRDQGEHRFRFTAMNTLDSTLRDEQEITVIVGDPTRAATQPQ